MPVERIPLRAVLSCLAVVASLLVHPLVAEAGTGCPGALVYQADNTSELDAGWTGGMHDMPFIGWSLRLGISGCAGSTIGSCGECAITSLITNAGGSNRRCSNDTSIRCTDDTPCTGGGGTCRFYATPPNPFAGAGVGACVVNEVNGSVSGTVDIELGTLATTIGLSSKIYNSEVRRRRHAQRQRARWDVQRRRSERPRVRRQRDLSDSGLREHELRLSADRRFTHGNHAAERDRRNRRRLAHAGDRESGVHGEARRLLPLRYVQQRERGAVLEQRRLSRSAWADRPDLRRQALPQRLE